MEDWRTTGRFRIVEKSRMKKKSTSNQSVFFSLCDSTSSVLLNNTRENETVSIILIKWNKSSSTILLWNKLCWNFVSKTSFLTKMQQYFWRLVSTNELKSISFTCFFFLILINKECFHWLRWFHVNYSSGRLNVRSSTYPL